MVCSSLRHLCSLPSSSVRIGRAFKYHSDAASKWPSLNSLTPTLLYVCAITMESCSEEEAGVLARCTQVSHTHTHPPRAAEYPDTSFGSQWPHRSALASPRHCPDCHTCSPHPDGCHLCTNTTHTRPTVVMLNPPKVANLIFRLFSWQSLLSLKLPMIPSKLPKSLYDFATSGWLSPDVSGEDVEREANGVRDPTEQLQSEIEALVVAMPCLWVVTQALLHDAELC